MKNLQYTIDCTQIQIAKKKNITIHIKLTLINVLTVITKVITESYFKLFYSGI